MYIIVICECVCLYMGETNTEVYVLENSLNIFRGLQLIKEHKNVDFPEEKLWNI